MRVDALWCGPQSLTVWSRGLQVTQPQEPWTEAQISAIRTGLDKVLACPMFAQAERRQRFLKFIVTETLAGHTNHLKGYTIGIEVFDREADFDPAIDAIVRVEAARLRAKLREYYEGEGRADPIRFDLPKGAYAVRIVRQEISPNPPLQKGGGTERRGDLEHPTIIEDKPSLVVLPFANMSSDPEQEYFADGITDCLITEISRLPGLFVISRHSSFVYKKLSKRAEEIGTELGVRYLLEGSVQRSGERVRISAQLIDTVTGAHVWAERYDRDLKDIFAVQDDVTRRIVAVLQIKLSGTEAQRIGHVGTSSLEAHDVLLHGLERFWVYSRESVEQARALFAKAVELDAAYPTAHVWLARTLVFQWIMLWDPRPKTLDQAFEHTRLAVDLDERLPMAHSMLCWVQLWRKQGEAAIAAGWRAIALDPNNADAYLFLSFSLFAADRGEEALHCIETGMRLNPHPSAVYYNGLGLCYFVLEDYDKAIAAFRRSAELTDVFIPCHFQLCMIYTLLGRDEDARVERDKVLGLTGGRKPVIQAIWLDEDLRLRMHGLAQLAGLT